VAHADPVVEPARERSERDRSAQRLGVGPRRLSFAVIGHRDDAVEQREIAIILIQHRKDVRERHEGGDPGAPLHEDVPAACSRWHHAAALYSQALAQRQQEFESMQETKFLRQERLRNQC